MYVKIPNNQAIFLAQLLLCFTELKFTMCILNIFSVDGWPGLYSVNNISWLERIFHFLYISASPNIHGKLLYINHHRPKGQLIEMMALIHEGKFITRLMGESLCTYNCTLPMQTSSMHLIMNSQLLHFFWSIKVQRKSVLQPAILASCS